MHKIMAAVFLLGALSVAAQVLDHSQAIEANLPQAAACLRDNQLGGAYRLSAHINPFYLRGDFDGDGHADYAVLVENTKTRQIHIAVCFAAAKRPILLGSGNEPAEAGDSFDWMDAWQVFDKGPVQMGADETPPPKLRGDALLVMKSEAASALLYWDGKRFRWYQQGD